MADSPLYELYRLHLVDSALEDMKKRAAALDGGKAILAEISRYKTEHAEALEAPKHLEAEIKDLESRSQAHLAKIKHLEKELYGGSVVNAKEAAGYEQEIATLKGLRSQHEDRELELMELLPAAEEAAKPHQQRLSQLAKAFEQKKQSDIAESEQLKKAYAEKSKERAPLAAAVSSGLLAQYDAIRKKHGGIGMGVVQGANCGACGNNLPTKVLDWLNSDKVITCESCHRILIKLVPTP